MSDEPLIELGVRFDEHFDMFEVYVQLRGETHYDTAAVAEQAVAEYLASMGPTIIEPSRCIVIPRPERHISTIKIQKNMHMVKFCVPCRVYTTINACPCCNMPTLASGRPPGEDAGVRARRDEAERDSRKALSPEPGSVTHTPEGIVIDVTAEFVKAPEETPQ